MKNLYSRFNDLSGNYLPLAEPIFGKEAFFDILNEHGKLLSFDETEDPINAPNKDGLILHGWGFLICLIEREGGQPTIKMIISRVENRTVNCIYLVHFNNFSDYAYCRSRVASEIGRCFSELESWIHTNANSGGIWSIISTLLPILINNGPKELKDMM